MAQIMPAVLSASDPESIADSQGQCLANNTKRDKRWVLLAAFFQD